MARKLESKVPKSKRTKTAQRLLALRKKMSWTQKELAREFGVQPVTVEKWEVGEREMSGPALKLLEIFEQNRK